MCLRYKLLCNIKSLNMSRARRTFDVVGALAGLVVFAPAMTVIAVAVLIRRRMEPVA